MPIYLSPGVYSKEVDLSQIVQIAGASVGAIVLASKRGPLGPQFISNDKAFVEMFGKPDPKVGYGHYAALDFLKESGQLWVNRVVAASTLYGILKLNTTTPGAPTLTSSTGLADPETIVFAAGDCCAFYPIGPGAYGNGYSISIPSISTVGGTFTVNIYDNANLNTPVETFAVSKNRQLDGFGRQTYIADVINTFSKYFRVVDNPLVTTQPTAAITTPVAFSTGADGTAPGSSEFVAGWDAFANPDDYTVNILIQGGALSGTGAGCLSLHQKMIEVAEDRADAFAVLDMPADSQAVASALTYRNTTLNANSSYAALYTPFFERYDEYNDFSLLVPPSGAVAAIFARTDSVRDPWWAPAGLNRGIIRNAIKLGTVYNQGDRDTLYPAQINMIKVAPGTGIAVWGQKTLQSKASALQSINVRRLLLVIEKAMASALQFSLHEPNDPFTRSQIVNLLTDFLGDVQARRGLYAFKVVSDESNNTPAIIDRNELHVDVYLQPVRAAEVIQLQSVITRTGASFEELIATGGSF